MMYLDRIDVGVRDDAIPGNGFGDGGNTGNGRGGGFGDGDDYGYGYGDGSGDGYGDGNGRGRGEENPYCTRLLSGDNILFIACQQVMLS